MIKKTITPWKIISTEKGPDLKLFTSRYDLVESPRNGMRMKAIVLESGDWVNVVAVTKEGKIVTVEQHRFGTGRVSIEIPAGIVDPGESPLETAKRELCEETGYTSDDWLSLGSVEANPAFLVNHCHFWLAIDAVKSGRQSLDESEDIAVDELSEAELKLAISEGRARNSLSLLALARVFDMRDVPFE